jgi:MFS family permease
VGARGPLGQRWRVALVLGLSLLVAYYDRLNISLALPLLGREQGWSQDELRHYGGLLMGLFYAGYGVANMLLAPLAARIGARRSLQIMVVLWALFTALGAWASQVLVLLMASRVLLGVSEGAHVPAMNALTKAWFPPGERSRANAIWIAGILLAMLSAPLLLVPCMNVLGWRAGFLLPGLLSLLLLPLVNRVVHDAPHLHPRASAAEIALVEDAVREEDAALAEPLARLLRRPGLLLLATAGCISNMIALGIAGWLPTYFTNRLGVPYAELHWPVAATQAFGVAGVALWAVLGDRSNRRVLIAACGFAGTALALFLALQSGTLWQAVLLFGLGTLCVSAWSAHEFALLQHQLPAASVATASGLYNGFTTLLGGGLGPLLTGRVLDGAASALPLVALCLLAAVVLGVLAARIRY